LLIIATNLKRSRDSQAISQEVLAERAKCHRNYVARTEAGQIDISVSGLFALAKGLGVEPCSLLKE
jgi:transcriptional regulator with XRE-family HTH domain